MWSFNVFTLWAIPFFFQSTVQYETQCSANQSATIAPIKNIWRPLSVEEVLDVQSIVTQRLHLEQNLASNTTDSLPIRVININLLQPNKSDALPYLDGASEEPGRYARASLLYRSPDGFSQQEYVVGPLPATNSTPVVPLTFPFNSKQPGRSRLPSLYGIDNPNEWIAALGEELANITKQIWNSSFAEGGVGPRLGTVNFEDDGTQTLWATLLGLPTTGFDSVTLLPLGVFFRVDVTSTQWQDWKIIGWYSQGKFYESTQDFENALLTGELPKPPPNTDGAWTSTDKQGSLPRDDLPPPITKAQGPQRFGIDAAEKYVSWMDFEFFIVTDPKQGVGLFDVRYRGQRLIYELALQEALAHYAGSDPQQSETLYFDTTDGMGDTMNTLVKDYDCPSHATYLDTAIPDSICLFEADSNFPLRRHTAVGQNYTSVAKNVVFTVRWISTVGNYDYLFDYNFFYDGAIEVSVRASGYISTAYYAGNEDYGFHIHDFLSGSLHDHVMTFKVDFDIYGAKNSVQKVEVVPATVEYPWSGGKSRNTMKLERSFITTESSSGISWVSNDAAVYAIVNKDTPNKYGEYPGYKIRRSSGATYLTVKNSTNAGNAIHYATADLFVTKQKDTEPKAADWFNTYNVLDPLVDFSKYLDGESLDQEDIVLWFNLGMHHVPHTGDLPNTMMTSAHSSIRLEPLNYLLGDPSVQSSQQIRVNYTSGITETFDAMSANCSKTLINLAL